MRCWCTRDFYGRLSAFNVRWTRAHGRANEVQPKLRSDWSDGALASRQDWLKWWCERTSSWQTSLEQWHRTKTWLQSPIRMARPMDEFTRKLAVSAMGWLGSETWAYGSRAWVDVVLVVGVDASQQFKMMCGDSGCGCLLQVGPRVCTLDDFLLLGGSLILLVCSQEGPAFFG